MAHELDVSYLRRVGYMLTDAKAAVIVAYADDSHRLRGPLWQPLQVKFRSRLRLRDEAE